MRNKWMQSQQFAAIQKYEWSPVEIEANAWFDWMKNIPTGLVYKAVASGSSASGILWSDSQGIAIEINGALKIYRNSPDDPVPFNTDTYVMTPNPSGLTVQGPYKAEDHWTGQIPANYSGIPVIRK